MKVILKVQQTYELSESGDNTSYALVNIEKEDAALMAKRLKMWASLRTEDDSLHDISFWDYSITAFGHSDVKILNDLEESEANFCIAPSNFEIAEDDEARIELTRMVITGSLDTCSLHWQSYLKHTNIVVETATLLLSDICDALSLPTPVTEMPGTGVSQSYGDFVAEAEAKSEPKVDPQEAFETMINAIVDHVLG